MVEASLVIGDDVEDRLSWAKPQLALGRDVQQSGAGPPPGRRLTGFFGLATSDRRTQRRVRTLLAGYLLAQLVGRRRPCPSTRCRSR